MAQTSARSPLEAARDLAPAIHSSVDQIERERELPRALFEALADAGLFHLMVPGSLGGGEIGLPDYIRVIEELGKADASTAWCINQGGVFASYAACLPPEVARLVWIDPPRSVVANTPVPDATAVPVAGGYRVTGRQGFSTGCRHASWLAARGPILEDGRPRRLADGQPDIRYFLLPAAEAEILDTWHVRGMRGTGTHHFAVTDVFVPEERAFSPMAPALGEHGPLYVIPRTLLFASGDAATALGLARSSVDTLVELAGGKTPAYHTGLLRDQALVQSNVGHAEADLRAGRAMLRETVREVWEAVGATGTISMDQRAALRLATTHAIRLAVQVVDTVYNTAGTTAIYQGHPLQRHFQDIHVISQHVQSRLSHYELVGRFYLGLDVELRYL
jgi:indole-3-acetate monooxygenase